MSFRYAQNSILTIFFQKVNFQPLILRILNHISKHKPLLTKAKFILRRVFFWFVLDHVKSFFPRQGNCPFDTTMDLSAEEEVPLQSTGK